MVLLKWPLPTVNVSRLSACWCSTAYSWCPFYSILTLKHPESATEVRKYYGLGQNNYYFLGLEDLCCQCYSEYVIMVK